MSVVCISLLAMCLASFQQEDSPAEQVNAVIAALEKERHQYIEKLKQATTTEQRNALMLQAPSPVPHAQKMLEIARQYRDSPASLDALIWLTKNTPASLPNADTLLAEAHELLLSRHIDDPRMSEFAVSLTWGVSADNESMLQRILSGRCNDSTRGIVELSLAYQWMAQMELLRFQQTRMEFAQDAAARTEIQASIAEELGDKTMTLLQSRSPESLRAQVIQSLEALVKSPSKTSGKWPLAPHRSVSDVAAQELHRLTSLDVGCQVPSLEERGIDGQQVSLANQKGRVVLLVFSGQWCAACRGLYAVERRLADELQNRRFTLIMINSDQTLEMAKSLAESEKMHWLMVWDGSPNGPIAKKWQVRSWPLVQVIDHQGLIRHQFQGAPAAELLEKIVLKAVAEAEKN